MRTLLGRFLAPRKIKRKEKKEDGREKQHDGTIKAFDRAENALPSKSSQERIEFRPHASLKNQPTGFTLSSFQFAEHGLTTINKKKKKEAAEQVDVRTTGVTLHDVPYSAEAETIIGHYSTSCAARYNGTRDVRW